MNKGFEYNVDIYVFVEGRNPAILDVFNQLTGFGNIIKDKGAYMGLGSDGNDLTLNSIDDLVEWSQLNPYKNSYVQLYGSGIKGFFTILFTDDNNTVLGFSEDNMSILNAANKMLGLAESVSAKYGYVGSEEAPPGNKPDFIARLD